VTPENPGVCVCGGGNRGCQNGKECRISKLPGSLPHCFRPDGASCTDNDKCFLESCFDGLCAICNEETGHPCALYEKYFVDEENGYFCKTKLDEDCSYGIDCETGFCWDPPFGKCKCNHVTNQGCPDDMECHFSSLPDNAPSCSLPDGAMCLEDADCASGNCYNNSCGACDEASNDPCGSDEACVFDEEIGHVPEDYWRAMF